MMIKGVSLIDVSVDCLTALCGAKKSIHFTVRNKNSFQAVYGVALFLKEFLDKFIAKSNFVTKRYATAAEVAVNDIRWMDLCGTVLVAGREIGRSNVLYTEAEFQSSNCVDIRQNAGNLQA